MSKKILFLSAVLIIGSTFFFAKNSYANVQEKVKCVFQGSVSAQECHTMDTENSNSLYYGGGCGGTGSCGWVEPNGPNGTQITWGSSCGGSAYTVLDGVDETVTFDCTIPTYSIALNPSGTDGTIVSSPAGIICHVINGTKSGYCGALFSAGTAVALTATPASGGVFTSWSTSTGDSGGCTGGSPTCTLTMNQNHQLGAVFSSAQLSALVISDVKVENLSVTTVKISWNTNILSNTWLFYGETSSVDGAVQVDNQSSATQHSAVLSNLKSDTRYYYAVSSRVEDSSTPSVRQTGEFTTEKFVQPSITVVLPNGGESWQTGVAQAVKWQTTGIPATTYMTIRLRHVGYESESPQTTQAPNNGSTNITPHPDFTASGSYKIEIETYIDNVRYVDTSDASFTITVPVSETPVAGVTKLGDGTYELNDGDKVQLDNGLTVVPIYFMSGSGSNEFSNVKFDVYRGATKITTTDFTRVGWDTKTFNVSSSLYDNFNENFVFKVYVESLVRSGANTNTTSWQSKITLKSGETTRLEAQKSDTQITQITTNANLLTNDKMSEILAELNQLRSIINEQQTQIKYLSSLLKDVQGISAASQAVLNNFITYGVDANTVKLGAGERAAVINSYKAAFDKLPTTEAELADVIKIANGRWPSITNQDAENQAKAQFLKIYKRAADMNGANDNAAVTIMAYGLRQKAENRNLNSEVNGIKIFKAIYGHTPKTTEEWNAMQAITYSGATQKTWSGYNPNGN